MKISTRFLLILLVLVSTARALPGQTPSTRRVMREKLTHSQRILEAILTSDFALLDRETAALTRVTETAPWQALRSPEYLKQSEAFLAANRALNEAAKNRDLDGAVRTAAGRGLVVDLRSSTYVPFWRPSPDMAARVVTVRVLHEVDGVRKVVSHFNKATKGRLVRALLEDGGSPRTPARFADHLAALGWKAELGSAGKSGTRLDVVVADL